MCLSVYGNRKNRFFRVTKNVQKVARMSPITQIQAFTCKIKEHIDDKVLDIFGSHHAACTYSSASKNRVQTRILTRMLARTGRNSKSAIFF